MRLHCLAAVLLAATQAKALYLNSTRCDFLSNVTLVNSKIRFTSTIAGGVNFTGDSTETSYNGVQTAIPAACRVACEIQTSANSAARFEVWLPVKDAWNSRFLAVGNGGWAGGINYPDIVTGLKKGEYRSVSLRFESNSEGFATMSTDTGHNSTQNDASWTGNAEQMIDLYVRFHSCPLPPTQIPNPNRMLTRPVATALFTSLPSRPKKSSRSTTPTLPHIPTILAAQPAAVKVGMKSKGILLTSMGSSLEPQRTG
jgi:hypothetical protein